MARILIAGCGYVGTALAARLAAEGHTVFGLRRRAAGLPGGVHPLEADLTQPGMLRRALEPLAGGDDPLLVVYAAAPEAGDEGAYRRVYREGLEALLEALSSLRTTPRHVFLTSSTSVYAQQQGEWVDEESPTEPRHFTGRSVLEGERLLAGSGLPATSLRLGGIYGPGRTSLLERVRKGWVPDEAAAARFTNRIHRDDAAGALAHLVERSLGGLPLEGVYLGVDCEPAPLGQVVAWLARELGVEPGRPGAPPTESHRPPGSKRCRNRRLLESGYRFRYPTFREGYAALLAASAGRTST